MLTVPRFAVIALMTGFCACSSRTDGPEANPAGNIGPAVEESLRFHPSLAAVRSAAKSSGKIWCVFLVLGDWKRHC